MNDAYLHVGGPRFTSAVEAASEMEACGIGRANLVLPPAMPDFSALAEARERLGGRVRLIGVPAGAHECERLELIEWQINFGILGLRLMPFEREPNLDGIEAIGQAGRWLFFINPWQSDTLRFLLEWLHRHETARIAVPHCLAAGAVADTVEDVALFREFLGHERVCAILSRHGGASGAKYPHEDLRPWVEEVIEAAGWDSVLWGSEYPVLYWRGETIPQAAGWLEALIGKLPEERRNAFLGDNAQRLFLDPPPPPAGENVDDAPRWTRNWVNGGGGGSPVARNLRLPAKTQKVLMSRYLSIHPESRPPLPEFISGLLAESLSHTVRR